jgi:sterol desaturase/sphingolipid hydroxylase (fatty acid hydroxylase superfamily)
MYEWATQIIHLLQNEIGRVILVAVLYIVFGIFELFFAAQKGHTLRGKLRNAFFTLLYIAGGVVITALLYVYLPVSVHYLPDRGLAFSLLLIFVYVFLTDFFFYWYHRFEHQTTFLWAIHELHHSDSEMNASTSMRTFFLEYPMQVFILFAPVNYLVGFDPLGAKVLPIILIVWLFFTHANLRLQLGRLTPFICGPQVHRIHHSNLPLHQDKNFAQFFPFIDILFGTYFAPRVNEFPATGTRNLSSDVSFGKAVARPFRQWTNI